MQEQLISEMSNYGLIVNEIISDGQIHRITVSEKNKKNGWYCANIVNSHLYCTFGRWDTDLKIKWNNNGKKDISEADKNILKSIHERIRKEQDEKYRLAKIQADNLWKKAEQGIHPYLEKKKILPHISKVKDNILLIPIRDDSGALVNLQRIYEDGTKKFLYGGQIKGCASAIDGKEKICICEGFATGASINEATGYKVIIAFNAANLIPVSEKIKSKYPKTEIIICGDNDESKTGEKFGIQAAKNISAAFRIPKQVNTDFNDISHEEIRDIIIGTPEGVISIDSLRKEDENISLKISEKLYNHGLIADGIQAAIQSGASDIIQYNLPVVISLIARAISGKLCCLGQYPNFFNVKIGGTSTGKTDADRIFKTAIIRSSIQDFYGISDFSSGAALLRALSDSTPQVLINMDESTNLFKRGKDDVIGAGKMSSLLELYTATGTEIKKPYGDSKRNIHIVDPCVSFLGNATHNIFDEFKAEDLTSGVLQRFDFWCYDGEIPYREIGYEYNSEMEKFINGLISIFEAKPKMKNNHDLSAIGMRAYPLKISDSYQKRIKEYSKHITDSANKNKTEDGVQGMISRKYNLSIKYSMIHAASMRPQKCLFDPLQIEDIEWGIEIAEMLCDWKINILLKRMTTGDFHRQCETFKDAIRQAMKNGFKPTGKIIANRKRSLKSLRPQQWNEIVTALKARKEITTDESGKQTCYYLLTE